MADGWIKLHRQIFTHDSFSDDKFSEREAFIWLISKASWKDKKQCRVGNNIVNLKVGEFTASYRFMGYVFKWDKNKIKRYLDMLKQAEMATYKTDKRTGQTTISICNYGKYQDTTQNNGTDNGTVAGQQRDSSGTATGQTIRTKELKKGKKEEDCSPQKIEMEFSNISTAWKRAGFTGNLKKAKSVFIEKKLYDRTEDVLSQLEEWKPALETKNKKLISDGFQQQELAGWLDGLLDTNIPKPAIDEFTGKEIKDW